MRSAGKGRTRRKDSNGDASGSSQGRFGREQKLRGKEKYTKQTPGKEKYTKQTPEEHQKTESLREKNTQHVGQNERNWNLEVPAPNALKEISGGKRGCIDKNKRYTTNGVTREIGTMRCRRSTPTKRAVAAREAAYTSCTIAPAASQRPSSRSSCPLPDSPWVGRQEQVVNSHAPMVLRTVRRNALPQRMLSGVRGRAAAMQRFTTPCYGVCACVLRFAWHAYGGGGGGGGGSLRR